MMRRLGLFFVSAALILSVGGSALASDTAEHAAQQIDQIVTDAEQQMAARADAFEAQVRSATSEKEIDSLRQAANAAVHEMSTQAATDVDHAAQGYDEELRSTVLEAKRTLVHVRNDAQARINAAAEKAKQDLVPTTTTTTVRNATPTTAEAPSSTTSSQPSATTTTEVGDGVSSAGGIPPPPPQTPLERWAASAFVADQPQVAEEPPRRRSGMIVALETVLPRDLIDWAMSPFRILWVIVRTTVDGGSAVLFPAAALAISAVVLGVVEARFRHRASSRWNRSTG